MPGDMGYMEFPLKKNCYFETHVSDTTWKSGSLSFIFTRPPENKINKTKLGPYKFRVITATGKYASLELSLIHI